MQHLQYIPNLGYRQAFAHQAGAKPWGSQLHSHGNIDSLSTSVTTAPISNGHPHNAWMRNKGFLMSFYSFHFKETDHCEFVCTSQHWEYIWTTPSLYNAIDVLSWTVFRVLSSCLCTPLRLLLPPYGWPDWDRNKPDGHKLQQSGGVESGKII